MPTTAKSQKTLKTTKPVLSVKPKRHTRNPSGQDFQEMIAEAAYYKAEQRGFVPGFEEEDWLQAEDEMMAMLQRH